MGKSAFAEATADKLKFHARMIKINGLLQVLGIEMGVDFRSSDAFVAQHILHCFQIGAALYQVGGK